MNICTIILCVLGLPNAAQQGSHEPGEGPGFIFCRGNNLGMTIRTNSTGGCFSKIDTFSKKFILYLKLS